MRIWALAATLAAAAGAAGAAGLDFSGQVRPVLSDVQASAAGPLAQAAALSPGIASLPASGLAVESELHASGHGLTAAVTLRQERLERDRWRSRGWVDEFYVAGSGGDWHFSAGKKIVGWDVGYAWRPNDVVQQEVRRTLLPVVPEGRPLLMAEHFDASTAWTMVLVNPDKPRARTGADEPAVALRVYRRDGSVDWHGFARGGAHTHASVGAAAAWVASDEIELHFSLRRLAAADTVAPGDPASPALLRADPWLPASTGAATQALLGGTWTNADQLSLLVEAWWDGTALSDARWRDWNQRNQGLAGLAGTPAPPAAVAGNLAWQTDAFGASANLRRANLYARLSWTLDKWQPAFDILYTPADRGRVTTASLGWQGDRVRLDGGWRQYGGPPDAVLAQVPTRRTIFFAATWSF